MRKPRSPYVFRQERYLDWAGGIRATDENHRHAKNYFERVRRAARGGMLPDRFRDEGQGMAKNVREGICALLEPEGSLDPSNVVLGNSATMTLLPILAALGRAGKSIWLMADFDAYSPMLSLLSMGVSGKDWDGVRRRLSMRSEAWYLDKITRQNFGSRRLCRSQPNDSIVDAWKQAGNPIRTISAISKGNGREQVHTVGETLVAERGLTPALLLDMCNGEGEAYHELHPLRDALRRLGGFSIADVSHTFGIYPLDERIVPDIIVGSSSKIIGAEPTIGFAYVADWVKDILAGRYIGDEAPFRPISFQFDPSLDDRMHDEMISLPELRSFEKALARFVDEDPVGRFARLAMARRRLLNSILRDVPHAEDFLEEHRTVFNFGPCLGETSAQMAFLRLESQYEMLERIFKHTKSIAQVEGLRSELRSLGIAPVRFRDALEGEGFRIKMFDERYTLKGEPEPSLARISFHPHVEPDIEGFVDAFSEMVRQGGS